MIDVGSVERVMLSEAKHLAGRTTQTRTSLLGRFLASLGMTRFGGRCGSTFLIIIYLACHSERSEEPTQLSFFGGFIKAYVL